MYDNVVPTMSHTLKALAVILKKAEAHCAAKNIKPEAITTFRLFPDMLPFTSQIQIATDSPKGAGARLSGTENPKFPDEEKTFEELQARIAKTIAFLESIDRKLFDGAATRTVKIRVGKDEREMAGLDYFNRQALPNFYFHVATAYNILRHNGVEIGKGDFLGRNI